MRVVFCWAQPSGYMTACLRELARRPGMQLRFIGLTPTQQDNAPFDASVVFGLDSRLLEPAEAADAHCVRSIVRETNPDVLVIAGWFHRPYLRLLADPMLGRARVILGADTPLRFGLRQWAAPLKIRWLLDRADAVVVPGERGYQVMRYWKVPHSKLRRGLYGFDFDAMARAGAARARAPGGWPRRFLFAGRLVSSKGIDVLADGYQLYRASVADPWPLTACGTGPLEARLRGGGVECTGFVQPDRLPEVFASSGAFVLPSRHDPWGVVIGEAAASGLPVVCSQECGAAAELVRDHHNGFIVPPGDAQSLARALRKIHELHAKLPEMGHASQALAAAFSPARWADRWYDLIGELCGSD